MILVRNWEGISLYEGSNEVKSNSIIFFEVSVESLSSCKSEWFGPIEFFPSVVFASHKLNYKEIRMKQKLALLCA